VGERELLQPRGQRLLLRLGRLPQAQHFQRVCNTHSGGILLEVSCNWKEENAVSNTTISFSPSFHSNAVLGISGGIDEIGGIRWELLGYLCLAWVGAYLVVWKGLHNSSKVCARHLRGDPPPPPPLTRRRNTIPLPVFLYHAPSCSWRKLSTFEKYDILQQAQSSGESRKKCQLGHLLPLFYSNAPRRCLLAIDIFRSQNMVY
jgi:hypothetical protein